jgi:hypothetical protein
MGRTIRALVNVLFHAHSGLRYLVLLSAVLAIGYFALGLFTKRPYDRGVRIFGAIYVGLVDLQILLGLVMVAMGRYYPALIGHIVMMIAAAGVAHVVLARNRKSANPGYLLPLIGVMISLVLLVGGILAIGRPIIGSGALGA